MNKLLLRSFVLVASIFVFTSLAFAHGPASVYKVTITKLELWKSGTGYVTVFDATTAGTSATLDIGSVSSGAAVGTFLAGLEVADGTYTKARVTPGPTFTYSGHDGDDYTTATAGANNGSAPGTAAQEGEWTITLTGDDIPEAQPSADFSTSITVLNGVADHNVRVSFNVTQAIQLIGGALFPAEPVVTATVVDK